MAEPAEVAVRAPGGESKPSRLEVKGLQKSYGGRRVVDWLTGDQLPRIC